MTNVLYLLERKDDDAVRYDEALGLVIRAQSVDQARDLASKNCGDEGPAVWLDANLTTCRKLLESGKSKVILRAMRAG